MSRSRSAALFSLGIIFLVTPSRFSYAAGTAADQICSADRVYDQSQFACGQPVLDSYGKPTGKISGYQCPCIDTEKAGTVDGQCAGPLDCKGKTAADLSGQQQQLKPLTPLDVQKATQGSSGSVAPASQQNTLQLQNPNGSLINWALNPTPLAQQPLVQSNSAQGVAGQIENIAQSPAPSFIQNVENFFSPQSQSGTPAGLSGGTMLGGESNPVNTVTEPGATPLQSYPSSNTFAPAPADANGNPVTPAAPDTFQQTSSPCSGFDFICKAQEALGFTPASEQTGLKTTTLSMFNDAQCSWGPCPSTPGVANRDLPAGTLVQVTNLDNGMTAVVPVVDRGPYVDGRDLDANPAAAKLLGLTQVAGLANVTYQPVSGSSVAAPAAMNVLSVDTGSQDPFAIKGGTSGSYFDTALQNGGLYQEQPAPENVPLPQARPEAATVAYNTQMAQDVNQAAIPASPVPVQTGVLPPAVEVGNNIPVPDTSAPPVSAQAQAEAQNAQEQATLAQQSLNYPLYGPQNQQAVENAIVEANLPASVWNPVSGESVTADIQNAVYQENQQGQNAQLADRLAQADAETAAYQQAQQQQQQAGNLALQGLGGPSFYGPQTGQEVQAAQGASLAQQSLNYSLYGPQTQQEAQAAQQNSTGNLALEGLGGSSFFGPQNQQAVQAVLNASNIGSQQDYAPFGGPENTNVYAGTIPFESGYPQTPAQGTTPSNPATFTYGPGEASAFNNSTVVPSPLSLASENNGTPADWNAGYAAAVPPSSLSAENVPLPTARPLDIPLGGTSPAAPDILANTATDQRLQPLPEPAPSTVVSYDSNSAVAKSGIEGFVNDVLPQSAGLSDGAKAQLADAFRQELTNDPATLQQFAPGAVVKNGDIVFPDQGTINMSALQSPQFQNNLTNIITNNETTYIAPSAYDSPDGVKEWVAGFGASPEVPASTLQPSVESQIPVPEPVMLSGEQITAQIQAQNAQEAINNTPFEGAGSAPVSATNQPGSGVPIPTAQGISPDIVGSAWESVKGAAVSMWNSITSGGQSIYENIIGGASANISIDQYEYPQALTPLDQAGMQDIIDEASNQPLPIQESNPALVAGEPPATDVTVPISTDNPLTADTGPVSCGQPGADSSTCIPSGSAAAVPPQPTPEEIQAAIQEQKQEAIDAIKKNVVPASQGLNALQSATEDNPQTAAIKKGVGSAEQILQNALQVGDKQLAGMVNNFLSTSNKLNSAYQAYANSSGLASIPLGVTVSNLRTDVVDLGNNVLGYIKKHY